MLAWNTYWDPLKTALNVLGLGMGPGVGVHADMGTGLSNELFW